MEIPKPFSHRMGEAGGNCPSKSSMRDRRQSTSPNFLKSSSTPKLDPNKRIWKPWPMGAISNPTSHARRTQPGCPNADHLQFESDQHDRFKILLTIVPPRPDRIGKMPGQCSKRRVYPFWIFGYADIQHFEKAALSGVPVYQVNDPNAMKGWSDYQGVCEELGL